MGRTRTRRPPTPSTIERARGLIERGGCAAVVGTGEPGPVAPLMHHIGPDGTTALLLPDDSALLTRLCGTADLPVMLELTGHGPVEMDDPVRELLWVVGWMHRPEPQAATELALRLAEVAPHPTLLDLGHGATLVRVRPGSIAYSDSEGSAALTPAELALASPDPFCLVEHPWLRHLDDAHPEMIASLARHLPPSLRLDDGARVRPLGIDRFGVRIRVRTPLGDHDVRLGFSSEAGTVDELRERLGELVGCPFRAT